MADGVDTNYVDLSDANLDGADLSGAQMSEASFLRTTLSGTDFGCRRRWTLNSLLIPVLSCERSQLVGARFFENHLVRTIFVDAVLTSAIFGRSEKNPFLAEQIENVRFNGAKLNKAIFSYAFVINTDFSKSNLQGAAFDHVEVSGNTKFIGADLSLTVFYSLKFTSSGELGRGVIDFSDATLKGPYVDGHPTSEDDFKGAKFCNTQFSSTISKRDCK